MNQILETISSKHQSSSKKTNNIYKFQFIISSITSCIFLLIFLTHIYKLNENEKIAKQLSRQYSVSTLYSNSSTYSDSKTSSFLDTENANNLANPFVIGLIKIDKINLNYPILSNTNKDLLDISLCRFAGPMPNEVGNLCIAGHNYVDYKLFSRLNELEKNDKIKIYDLSGKMIEYYVIKKYETEANNLSCTSQETSGKVIVTLLTCNNVSGKRLVVVAEPVS